MLAPNTGASYEGKGAIAAKIAHEFPVHVRVGAANAGHTVYTQDAHPDEESPTKHVLQQIPCAAYTNPGARLFIGPGAQISGPILLEEIERNAEWREAMDLGVAQIYIDPRAHVICDHHIQREVETDLGERIGSTSTKAKEGIGVAQAARVMRERDTLTMDHHPDLIMQLNTRARVKVQPVDELIDRFASQGKVLLEGTQGTGLSLTTGAYPYCTSRNTTASGLAADCGVGPGMIERVVVVARTFPIRVAGTSGPFYDDSEETTWHDLGIPAEFTTVTKLERRVATFSMKQIVDAVRLNSATEIALTFCDYLSPSLAGKIEGDPTIRVPLDQLPPDLKPVLALSSNIERATGAVVRYWGTGPHTVIDRYGLRLLDTENDPTTEPQEAA